MAKWGEGDPRWIVEDRPDATNVNNWHWYVDRDVVSRPSLLFCSIKQDNERCQCLVQEQNERISNWTEV